MFIFILSLEPDNFGPFQSRFPILSDAVWVEGFEQLKVILKTANEETVFIIDLKPSLPELQSYVLTIRSLSPRSKVIFVTEVTTASDLKAHQFSPVGGDAYVHLSLIHISEPTRRTPI